MLNHASIWQAIDIIAENNGMTTSGLARKAGLDATTFNKSKRYSEHARPRWPSLESIVKILQAVNMDFIAFAHYASGIESELQLARRIPLVPLDRHTYKHHILYDGSFTTSSDQTVQLMSPQLGHHYALTMRGTDFAPVYNEGETIIVSENTEVYIGSRIIALTHNGLMIMGTIIQENMQAYIVETIEKSPRALSLPKNALKSIHRIIWLSQ